MTMVEFKTEKKFVPIDKILPNRWNPNFMTKEVFEKQKNSIHQLGFLGSILVRKINHTSCDYEIMDGEHRWKALKESNATECPVEIIQGEVSNEDAQLLTILLNNLRGSDDVFKRAKILESLDEKRLSLFPMTKDEIEHEKRFVKFDFAQYEGDGEDMPEREFSLVIVLPMNTDEAVVWMKAKEEMMKRGYISEKSKKKQDIQMIMFLIKNFFSIALASKVEGSKVDIEI